MKTTVVDLYSMASTGSVKTEIQEGILSMTTTRAIHDVGFNIRRDKISSYLTIPGKYHLPLKIDMSFHIDTPEVLLLMGMGHISIGSPWMENRRIEDISEPMGKPKMFDNRIPFNEIIDVSVILGIKEMQILINGEERYYSKRERYMKSQYFEEQNIAGFTFGITCTKRAKLDIHSIIITEYEQTSIPIEHNPSEKQLDKNIMVQEKPSFDVCIENLPNEIKKEIIDTDMFLKSLKGLKFKRIIEKHGNKITYVESTQGVSYALYLSDNVMHHSIQFYIVTNSRPEQWHRVKNPLDELLEKMEDVNPDLAKRIFYNLNECIGCGDNCLAKTVYTFQSERKVSCHGNICFKMCISDFQDVREFFLIMQQFLIN